MYFYDEPRGLQGGIVHTTLEGTPALFALIPERGPVAYYALSAKEITDTEAFELLATTPRAYCAHAR